MAYLVESKVRRFFHDNDRQVTKDAVHAIDIKVYEYLNKILTTFNGHHRRIDAKFVACVKM